MFLSLLHLPDFSNPAIWISLLTISFLEIVLGVDNIIFISIAANRLPEAERAKARNIGLILAMIFRIILLFGITYLIAMQSPWFTVDAMGIHAGFTGQSVILILGGVFLLYKSTSEIHHKLEDDPEVVHQKVAKGGVSLTNVIVQIGLINIVFSFDAILTAVGLTDEIIVMILAIVFSVLIMMWFAGPIGDYVNRHPTLQMLGLAFLILIGFMLIAEGAHLAHLKFGEIEIGAVPKGYLYFAIAFSLGVEFLNLKLRKRKKPVQLRGYLDEGSKD